VSNIVDISYSVPEKELQGRRCMKDMETGKTWLEEKSPVLPVVDLVSTVSESVVGHAAGMRDHCARHDVVPTAELKGLPVGPPKHEPDRKAIRQELIKQYYR